MKTAMENTLACGISIAAMTVTLMVAGGGMLQAQAETTGRNWGNPCDTRDLCSADPARYSAYREDSMVKSYEYVAEMNWTAGGPPASAVVATRVLKSADAGSTAPCDVRDACQDRTSTWKVVRVGPAAGDTAVAGAGGDRIAASQNRK